MNKMNFRLKLRKGQRKQAKFLEKILEDGKYVSSYNRRYRIYRQ